jgi:Tfp pilus assembly protein PilF
MKPATQAFLAGAIIVLAAVAVYCGIFSVPFVFDDFNAVSLNPTIKHLWPMGEVLRTPQGTGSGTDGRPLANLSLAINYAFGGLDPAGYHVFSVAVHALTALTLFGVLRRTLLRWSALTSTRSATPPTEERLRDHALFLAFAIALLWAVHPLQTESVTTVVHRTELLVSLFYLLTLYCFIRGARLRPRRGSDAAVSGFADRAGQKPETGAEGWFVLSIFCCLLGMASKEVMVSAPLIVFLYDRTFVAGTFREAWRQRRGWHLGLASTWTILIYLRIATPGRGATGGFGQGMSPWDYALTQCRAIVHYLRLSFWPHPLVLDYGNGLARHVGEVLPQGLLLILLLAGTVAALRYKPALGFAGACFFAILGPSSSFVPLTTQTMAEHRMYLPLAAVIAIVVCGLQAVVAANVPKSKALPLGAAFLATAAAGFGLTTVERNRDYRSAVTLWTKTISQVPDNPRPHDNLADALLEVGRVPEAVAQYEAALRIDPNDAQAHYNLGGVLLDAGRTDEAILEYQAALRSAPNFSWARNNLGTALSRAGRFQEALEQYVLAVQADPAHAQARFNLANLLARGGRLDDAIVQYEAAVRLAPDMAAARFNLAQTLARVGRTGEAVAQLQILLRQNPGDTEARASLSRLLASP